MSFLRVGLGLGCAILVAMTAACGGAVDASSSGESETTGNWSAMLSCDDGAAVLQVDRDDATQVQMVVRGEQARRHIEARVDRAMNTAGEIVVVGKARTPVEASTFDLFVDESGRYDRAPALSLNDVGAKPRVVAEVRRSAVDRVTLAFQEVTTERSCSGTVEGRFCRGGEWSEKRGIKELASWSFSGCH